MTVENFVIAFMVGFAFNVFLSILTGIKALKDKTERACVYCIVAVMVNFAFFLLGLILLYSNLL